MGTVKQAEIVWINCEGVTGSAHGFNVRIHLHTESYLLKLIDVTLDSWLL